MRLTDPSTLFLFLAAGIVALLMVRTRARLPAQKRETDDARENGSVYVAEADRALRDNSSSWEVQMHETARELSAQIDAKLSLLQALTVEADCAAQRLEEALDRAYPSLPPGSQAESLRPANGNERHSFDAAELAPVRRNAAAVESPLPEATDRSRRRDEIYHLADYGFAATEIARRVHSPIGEVELILSLRGT